jgi:quinol monooxygenase YgiN
MSNLSQAVSINPYFKVQPGKLDAFKETMKEFVARTATEDTCLYYDFSVCGDQVFCREAYIGAAGVLRHLENVGSCIEEALTFSELYRIEIHGPKAELDQLRQPLADLNPDFYEHVTGTSK